MSALSNPTSLSTLLSDLTSFNYSAIINTPQLVLPVDQVLYVAGTMILVGAVVGLYGYCLLKRMVFLGGFVVGWVMGSKIVESMSGMDYMEMGESGGIDYMSYLKIGMIVLVGLLAGYITLYLFNQSISKVLLLVGIVILYYLMNQIKTVGDYLFPLYMMNVYQIPVPLITSDTILPIFMIVVVGILCILFSWQLVTILLIFILSFGYYFDNNSLSSVYNLVISTPIFNNITYVPVSAAVIYHTILLISSYFFLSYFITVLADYLIALLTSILGSISVIQGIRMLNTDLLWLFGLDMLPYIEKDDKIIIKVASLFQNLPAIVYYLISFSFLFQICMKLKLFKSHKHKHSVKHVVDHDDKKMEKKNL